MQYRLIGTDVATADPWCEEVVVVMVAVFQQWASDLVTVCCTADLVVLVVFIVASIDADGLWC